MDTVPAAATLWEGLLLLEGHIKGEAPDATGWICSECRRSLEVDTMPKFALANNMWIGPIPHELAVLTLPKELLISRHFPRCYIFKLYPKDSRHVNPNHLQQGMAGNVTLYDMNINDVTKMVEGQFLPQPVASLASVLAITYVGTRHLPKDWLKSTFRVRRDVVFNALTWLKAHNPLYADIQISEVQLAHLPEDDVPQEIVSVIRHEASDDVAIRENEGYVPTDNEVRNGVCCSSVNITV
jgi:hypothetical protein